MKLPAIVLPQLYADRLASSGKNSGLLDVKFDPSEELGLIDGVREGQNGTRRAGLSTLPRDHHLGYATSVEDSALWFKVDPVLHLAGVDAFRHGAAIKLGAFRDHIPSGDWINPGPGGYTLVITLTEFGDPAETHFCAWRLQPDHDSAEVLPLDVVSEAPEVLDALRDAWPLEELAERRVLLIGAGSIGSVAADALAAYGVRRLILLDPDRLHLRNLARHRLGADQLGRYKVNGLADRLRARDPLIDVEPLPLNVIFDADIVRALLTEIDCVVVSSDGVESRRAANHLIRQAGKPAVFACVLADGGFGEILRIRPPRIGCLLCARAELVESGAMDPEPGLDRDYGTGTRHLPMTAVGGDLGLVGQLAAKAAISTLLEPFGYRDQRLPGDHAILGLRPKPDMASPFDIDRAGEVRWRELPPPRPNCPTCGGD